MDCNKITSRLTLIASLTLQANAALGNGNSTLLERCCERLKYPEAIRTEMRALNR